MIVINYQHVLIVHCDRFHKQLQMYNEPWSYLPQTSSFIPTPFFLSLVPFSPCLPFCFHVAELLNDSLFFEPISDKMQSVSHLHSARLIFAEVEND